MATTLRRRLARLRQTFFPNEAAARPPRPGTSREDIRTFIILIVVASTISISGVTYALLTYG